MTITLMKTEKYTPTIGSMMSTTTHVYTVEQGKLTRVLDITEFEDYPGEVDLCEATIETECIEAALEHYFGTETLLSIAFDDEYDSFKVRNKFSQKLYKNKKGRYINYRGQRLYLPHN